MLNIFSGCSGLITVTIGSGIEYIGDKAFSSCSELIDVYCYAVNVPDTKADAFDHFSPHLFFLDFFDFLDFLFFLSVFLLFLDLLVFLLAFAFDFLPVLADLIVPSLLKASGRS